MLENCYPQPTCYDRADAYLEERITACRSNDEVDVETCIETARGHHAKMLKECDQRECEESVYADAEPSFNECNTIDDEVEYAECIARVEQWIKDMLQKCYPEQTCHEDANDYLVEALDACYQNTDSVEIDICVKEVKERHAKWIEECDLTEC
jgi:bacterioferritin (cytochrome b1)